MCVFYFPSRYHSKKVWTQASLEEQMLNLLNYRKKKKNDGHPCKNTPALVFACCLQWWAAASLALPEPSLLFSPTPTSNPSPHHSSLLAAVCAPPRVGHIARISTIPLQPIQSLLTPSCSIILYSFSSLTVSSRKWFLPLNTKWFSCFLRSWLFHTYLSCQPASLHDDASVYFCPKLVLRTSLLQPDLLPCKSKCCFSPAVLPESRITSRGKTCVLSSVMARANTACHC